MPERERWISATELAEYAYCPRALYYRDHPPPGGPSRLGEERAQLGQRYHTRELARERRREEHASAYWALLGSGLLLAAGGIAWLFLR